jgi:hypothetical protein
MPAHAEMKGACRTVQNHFPGAGKLVGVKDMSSVTDTDSGGQL